jgi:hypothetical protein
MAGLGVLSHLVERLIRDSAVGRVRAVRDDVGIRWRGTTSVSGGGSRASFSAYRSYRIHGLRASSLRTVAIYGQCNVRAPNPHAAMSNTEHASHRETPV